MQDVEAIIQQIENDGYCKLAQLYSPQQVRTALVLTEFWYQKT